MYGGGGGGGGRIENGQWFLFWQRFRSRREKNERNYVKFPLTRGVKVQDG